jgi:pyruvate formate lyase activating enzyme
MSEIESDRSFFDESGGGVTFSGGDPVLQSDFLLALLRACKERDIHTAVDTSGAFPWKTLEKVRPYIDLFLFDIKVMDEARHRALTGVANNRLLHNLRQLSLLGHKIIIRVAVIPGVNDDEQSMRAIGEFAASLPHVEGVSLLPYHGSAVHKYEALGRPYEMAGTVAPVGQRMQELAALLGEYIGQVKIGG